MNKKQKIAQFDPSGVGLNNGRFIGLPFDEADAEIVFLSVPWDVTVSYGAGTAHAPQNILDASPQLDLYDPHVPDAWKIGHYFRPPNANWQTQSQRMRVKAFEYIQYLEAGGDPNKPEATSIRAAVNAACAKLKTAVYDTCQSLLANNKLVGLVGGDHSTPLGFLEALAERHTFGVLQIDAHLDLRQAYEGFTYSHASIFYNALQIPAIQSITSVGIRDYCAEEVAMIAQHSERLFVFYDQRIHEDRFKGISFDHICDAIVQTLPHKVYISFDIDGLDPTLCPNTGTPVPGGLQFHEALFLIKKVVESGRTIVGFDLCEVGTTEWEGNVGARLLYAMSNLAWKSQKNTL